MFRHEEFDVAEVSLSSYLVARDQGRELVAIPVFPYRMFRHSYLWCSRRSVKTPSDLKGKRMGSGMYQVTTSMWIRGFLADDYGVAASDVTWVLGDKELVPFVPPTSISMERASPGQNLEELLLAG